jgi:hypothetical protein
VRLVSREKPLKGNPVRGSGMKQARKASDGASHRGRAKRRGWTVRVESGISAHPVDVAGRCREEGNAETPWKALAPVVQRIARSEDAAGKQRAVGGVNVRSYAQSSAGDDNARGSTNLT